MQLHCPCGFCFHTTLLGVCCNKKFCHKRFLESYCPQQRRRIFHCYVVPFGRGFSNSFFSLLVAKNESDNSDNTVSLTGDGGVKKTIVKEGSGDYIKSGCKVTVHYTGYLDNGKEFDSTRKRQEPFSFSVDKGQVIRGWDIALLSMKEGETAKVRCSPSYAYGERGVPPSIPPNASLTFEIQVLKVEGLPNTYAKNRSISDGPVVTSKSKTERKPFYFISPFASQTGEKAPWWLNPIITFSLIFLLVGIAFTIVVKSGALHTSYLNNVP